MMDELLQYPTTFPVKALTVLAPIVRTGQIGDKAEAGRAALTLQAYGMGQWLTSGPANAARALGKSRLSMPRSVGDKAAMKALDALEGHAAPKPAGAQAAPIDRRKLAEYALKLAKFILPLLMGN